jgi:hypothetical protein
MTPESQIWSSNGIVRIDPGAAAGNRPATDHPSEFEETQLSAQDVLLLQACLRFVLKHHRDPSVSARLQQLAETLARVADNLTSV